MDGHGAITQAGATVEPARTGCYREFDRSGQESYGALSEADRRKDAGRIVAWEAVSEAGFNVLPVMRGKLH